MDYLDELYERYTWMKFDQQIKDIGADDKRNFRSVIHEVINRQNQFGGISK